MGFVAVDSASRPATSARPIVGRGSAYADVDGDGDLDVVLTQIAGPPLLLRNDQSNRPPLAASGAARRRAPNRAAIGARVELSAGGVTQRRQVMPTRSYLSRVERAVTFGLGEAMQVDAVKIVWPDGTEQTLDGLEVDRLHVVEQGG